MKPKPPFFLFFISILFVGIFFASEVKAYCSPSASGNLTISADCSFSGTVNGVEGGMTINSGRSMTVQANQTIVWNPGSSITINGTININSSGILRQSYLWMVDADGDGYSTNTTMVVGDSSPGGTYRRRNTLSGWRTGNIDLNDGNASVTTYIYGQSTYYSYGQSTYYSYGQSTYYSYGQSTYYSYGQSAYYNYGQSAYAPALIKCGYGGSTLTGGASNTAGRPFTQGSIDASCASYCGSHTPVRACGSPGGRQTVWAHSFNFVNCVLPNSYSAGPPSPTQTCRIGNAGGHNYMGPQWVRCTCT